MIQILLLAAQDEIFKQYTETSALWTMCWMNFWCGAYNLVYLFAATASGWDLAAFCRRFPEVRLNQYHSVNEAGGAQELVVRVAHATAWCAIFTCASRVHNFVHAR